MSQGSSSRARRRQQARPRPKGGAVNAIRSGLTSLLSRLRQRVPRKMGAALALVATVATIYTCAEPNLMVEDSTIGFEPPFLDRDNRRVGDSIMTMMETSFLIKNHSWRSGGYVRDIQFVPQSLSEAVNPRMHLIDLDRRPFGGYERRLVAFKALLAVPLEESRDSIRVEIKLLDQAGANITVANADTIFHPAFSVLVVTHHP
jgi:hypothetical protein